MANFCGFSYPKVQSILRMPGGFMLENEFKHHQQVIDRLSVILPVDRIISEAGRVYGSCTTGTERKIIAAVKPQFESEIQAILRMANEYNFKIYPISTGKNWGYGTALPVTNDCLLMDLSLMNKILDCDPKMGWVRVEPGVTQQDLRVYLDQLEKEGHGKFLVPTTGAGPHASLLGNIMERGYGITPHKDHFEALLSLRAVLPTGEIYQSILKDLGGDELHQNFKWGLGPYVEGLFAQSNYAVVTEVTIALARAPECISIFSFDIGDEASFRLSVEAIREITQELGSIVSGINLMNQRRVLSMKMPYPQDDVDPEMGIISDEKVREYGRQYGFSAWTGVGALYGSKDIVAAAEKMVKKKFHFAKRIRFIKNKTVSQIKKMIDILPQFLVSHQTRALFEMLSKLKDILEGRPNEVAIPLVYWKSSQKYSSQSSQFLHKDSCGLLWYAPLVVIKKERVLEYTQMVEKICREHKVEPLITLTSISERCFDSTVPILFDKNNLEEVVKAKRCYEALLKEGQMRGFYPYRLNIDTMRSVFQNKEMNMKVLSQLKACFDPKQVLAPGRYCPQ